MVVNPGKNETIEAQGRQYRRLCIKTHVITDADNIIDVVTKYAAPGSVDRALAVQILRDNPLGQSHEQTPMGIIRPVEA